MSDINDDLLNYELGDDIDDQDELIANEDELLLSDEEISQQEEDLLLDGNNALVGCKKTPTIEEPTKSQQAEILSGDETPFQQVEVLEKVSTTTKPTNVATPSHSNTVDSICSSSSTSSVSKIAAKESEVTTTNNSQSSTRPILKRNIIDTKKLPTPIQQQPQQQTVPITVQNVIAQSTAKNVPIEPQISPIKPQIIQPPKEKLLKERQFVPPETSRILEETSQPKNDEVSSTNTKDTEANVGGNNNNNNNDQLSEASQTELKPKSVVCDNINAEEEEELTVISDETIQCSQETVQSSSDATKIDNSISQSQQSSSTTYDEGMYSTDDQYNQPEFETEDSDDSNERLNPKTCVEREEQLAEAEDVNRQQQQRQQFNRKHVMGRGGSTFMGPRPCGQYPQHYNPFQTFSSNENFNPQHFRPAPERPMLGPAAGMPPTGTHIMFRNVPPFGGFPRQQFSMDLRPMRPMMRMPMPNNGPSYRPFNDNMNIRPGGVGAQIPPPLIYDNLRPRLNVSNTGVGASQQFIAMRPAQFMRPGNVMHQQRPHQQQMPSIQHGGPQSTSRLTNTGPLMIPTKVLINPNFKGGVEAVTNKIMLESQYFAQNDAELLRKQEAFINQNRMHIEKRRFERSPDRDRTRERSYSPPSVRRRTYNSREREPPHRRPPYTNSYHGAGTTGDNNSAIIASNSSGLNRGRRAGSKEMDSRNAPKRRGTDTLARDDDKAKSSMHVDQQEDEETRAYRQEIEKQKSMREKILRDKELRRRKAAAEIKKEVEEKKPIVDDPVSSQKLTPIIVTEKKIISLKKKSDPIGSSASRSSSSMCILPTAKVQPETKFDHATHSTALAVVKPVVKQTIAATIHHNDTLEDYYDEDELLADSPPPPPQTSVVNMPIAGKFTNRRVILKQSTAASAASPVETMFQHSLSDDPIFGRFSSSSSSSSSASSSATVKSKGIFERLDRRIGVNETAKRKIQRVVINKTD